MFSAVFFVSKHQSFLPFWNLSERTVVLEIELFLSLNFTSCFSSSFERRVERRERKRERAPLFVAVAMVVSARSFTTTPTPTPANTNGLRMQNSSTLCGKRIGQKRGKFVNENKNRAGARRSATMITKAAKQGGSGTRPYTLRVGDTLESIASKRKLNVETLRNMNKKIGSATPKIGQTIVIPSGALSARDLEIINGIAKINAPRTYIPRKGETIGDVITARKIDFAEVQKLNPDVKLGTFSGKESLKLPPGKYTVREREMLQGCGILPQDAVSIKLPGAESARNILVATVLIGAYSMYFATCRRYQKYGTKLFGNDREEDNQD